MKDEFDPGGYHKKILLCLLPFWSPLTPPLGISVLKSHLKQHGFDVSAYDFNTEKDLWGFLNKYFKIIKESIPPQKYGNFNMISYDVLSNHLTAYIHKTDEKQYLQLIDALLRKNFFTSDMPSSTIAALDNVVSDFYSKLHDSILRTFNRFRPDIFGVSVYSTSLGPSMYAARLIKENAPDVLTMMGGGVFADHLATNSPNLRKFMEKTEQYLDVIVSGEGEVLLKNYLSGKLKSNKRLYTLKDIDGETLDLKTVDIPDFSDFDMKSYVQMAVYATRSCPHQCKFCSETVQWGRFRKKATEQIFNEIVRVKHKFGGTLFLFGDSIIQTIINDFSRKLISSGSTIYWDGYVRADPEVCDPSNTTLWRKAGYYRARLGIESGSQRILDLMDKRISIDQIKKALESLANAGIKTTTYWVIGYPGETEGDFQETLQLLGEIKDYIYEADWHPFYFFPYGQVGSRKWVRKFGVELVYPDEFSDMLVTQTWRLKTDPAREDIYERLNRFSVACKELKIPNPYSLLEIYQADKRWKKLHPEAGPNILDLHN